MEKYEWGTQVYPTKLSVERNVNKAKDLGICLGYKGQSIRVVKFDRCTHYTYSTDFWTKDTTGWKG